MQRLFRRHDPGRHLLLQTTLLGEASFAGVLATFITVAAGVPSMRAAKWPFNAFQENVKKARALAVAQQYLNRFLSEGPDKFMDSVYAELTGTLKGVIGIDLYADLIQPLVKDIGEELTQKYAAKIPKAFVPPDAKTAERAAEKMLKLAEPIISITTLEGQTLLEQAVVLGVTAYETYITDTAEALFRLNPSFLDKFSPELDEGLKWSKISRHAKDAREAATDFLLHKYKALELTQVRNLFARLVNIENVFGNEETERSIRKFIEHRHIIVHRAGKIDRKFQDITGSRQALGTYVELTTTYVAEGLETLSAFVGGLQTKLEAHASGTTEMEPPES